MLFTCFASEPEYVLFPATQYRVQIACGMGDDRVAACGNGVTIDG